MGSSSSSRPGRRARAPARTSRCFSPPESACGGPVAAVGEADGGQRLVDPRPDLSGGDAGVLQPEGDVVPGAGHDQLAVGVLGEQPQPVAARPRGGRAVDGELAGQLGALGVEQPGQRREQRGLARAGRAGEQDPLAGLDDEVDAGQRPGVPGGVADAEAPGDEPGRPQPACRPASARAADGSVTGAGSDARAAGGERAQRAGAGQGAHQQQPDDAGEQHAAEHDERRTAGELPAATAQTG